MKEKESLPESGSQHQKIFLYGLGEPRLSNLLQQPDVPRLIADMFGTEPFQTPADRWRLDEDAISSGLLVKKENYFQPGPKLVMVSRQEEEAFRTQVGPLLDTYFEIVQRTIPKLQHAYAACSTAKAFSWEECSHTVVTGLFLDLAVGIPLRRPGGVLEIQEENIVWAFQEVKVFNGIGVSWSGHPQGRAAFVDMWHQKLPRTAISLAQNMVEKLRALLLGDHSMLGSQEALVLRYHKILKGAGTKWHLTVPVFMPADTQILLAALLEGAEQIASQVITPAVEIALKRSSWREIRLEKGAPHAVVRLMLDYILDRLDQAGCLPPLPSKDAVPFHWGRWFWLEDEGTYSMMPEIPTVYDQGGTGH